MIFPDAVFGGTNEGPNWGRAFSSEPLLWSWGTDSVDSEIARIDIDDSDAMPKAWKLQGFDNQNVKKWFDE